MNTLTIPQIFANFSFYKENYLSIIKNADQYYVPVEGAEVQVWPLASHQLFLGDLLQLWFADKWTVDVNKSELINTILRDKTLNQSEQDLFVYELNGSSVTEQDTSKAWSLRENKSVDISVGTIFQFYCVFKGLSRPIQNLQQTTQLKSAI
ncbi:hypothetical protein A6M14_00050 [Acinetobacter sp. Ac_877]|uniref:hypothetical protein n=1 Tax=Acinetobacter portensis TaxID=1839785 RepID=UPI00128D534E|nr:hypothetical protein [Acinetobacter portensis]MPW41053.1 hypothetical protein [Acinetobacter portensis]